MPNFTKLREYLKNLDQESSKLLTNYFILLAGSAILLIAATNHLVNGNQIAAIFFYILAFASWIIVFIFSRQWKLISQFLTFFAAIGLLTGGFFQYSEPSGHFLWLLVFPVVAIFFIGHEKGLYWSLGFFIAIIILQYLPLESVYSDASYAIYFDFFNIYVFTTLIVYVFVSLRLREKKNLSEQINLSEQENKQKDDFFTKLSHEIRTPLNDIMVVSTLLDDTQLNEKQEEYLQTIISSTNSLINVVNEISQNSDLDLSEKQLDSIQFDIQNSIRNTIEFFHTEKFKNTQININFTFPKTALVLGDPIRLKQVLINLIDNLISDKHSESIKISIDISERGESKGLTVYDFKISTNSIIYHQLADGKDRYFYKKQDGTFKYLDITLSKKLIELFNGKFVLNTTHESSEIQFDIHLKKIKDLDPKARTVEFMSKIGERAAVKLENANVLLVEDNIVNQKIVNLSLKKMVQNIDIANNGKEALDKFVITKYDIILMDVQMPIMDGITATKKIRELELETNTNTPIIAITANALTGDKENCLAAGMNDYISKPFQIEDLVDRMKNLLEGN